ncbi:MAG: hypothetical protein AAFX02_11785, partial [Pseudomonadota bacterium]
NVRNANGEIIVDYRTLLTRFKRGADNLELGFTICYCSVFEDCWQLRRSEGPNPSEVESCQAQPEGISY